MACVSNMAAGIHNRPLRHAGVLEKGGKVSVSMSKIVKDVVGFADNTVELL